MHQSKLQFKTYFNFQLQQQGGSHFSLTYVCTFHLELLNSVNSHFTKLVKEREKHVKNRAKSFTCWLSIRILNINMQDLPKSKKKKGFKFFFVMPVRNKVQDHYTIRLICTIHFGRLVTHIHQSTLKYPPVPLHLHHMKV